MTKHDSESRPISELSDVESDQTLGQIPCVPSKNIRSGWYLLQTACLLS